MVEVQKSSTKIVNKRIEAPPRVTSPVEASRVGLYP